MTRAATSLSLLWVVVAGVIGSFLFAAFWIVVAGNEPGRICAPRGVGRAVSSERDKGGALWLAGSGSNLPVTWKLVVAFCKARVHPPAQAPDLGALSAPTAEPQHACPIVIHESIGSAGAVRATADGVVDLGLVSRPLQAGEQALGLRQIPYARVAIVAAVNLAAPEEILGLRELSELYADERRTWRDGSRAVVLVREKGDSTHAVLAGLAPPFAAANELAMRAAHHRVLYSDRGLLDALVATQGAVGLTDVGIVRAGHFPVRVVGLASVEPSAANVLSGAYPYVKELSFVVRGEPSGPVAELLAFVSSADGAKVLSAFGYVALSGGL